MMTRKQMIMRTSHLALAFTIASSAGCLRFKIDDKPPVAVVQITAAGMPVKSGVSIPFTGSPVTVTLDGSHSTDADGHIIRYTWMQTDLTAKARTALVGQIADSGLLMPTDGDPPAVPQVELTLGEGKHKYSLWVTDDKGVVSAPATLVVAIGAKAAATIAGFGMGNTVTGSASFRQVGSDVIVKIDIANCLDGKSYPVHIHQGASCTDATTQGDHWDMTRGEGIPDIVCMGAKGSTTTTRMATPPELAWSVGGDPKTNVVGHVVVVHEPDVPTMPARIACGPVTLL